MVVLGIESSCDETAAAVVRDGSVLLSNVIASQVKVHERYGGVVPEIASRKHIEAIVPVILQALEDAGTTLAGIDGIAVTRGPGLIGSLLVGLSAAKAIAFARRLPLVGVNHLEGHVAAAFLMECPPAFPFVALVVSGGHTTIYRVDGFQRFTVLGQTRDDAAGEAFDKAAKLLEIGYPGGVVMTRLKKRGTPFTPAELPDLTASYQEAICDVLVEKTLRAAAMVRATRVVVCGGVAANSRLRERFRTEGAAAGIEVFIPPPILCTDNAAMIAVVGTHLLKAGCRDGLDLNAVSRWPLTVNS